MVLFKFSTLCRFSVSFLKGHSPGIWRELPGGDFCSPEPQELPQDVLTCAITAVSQGPHWQEAGVRSLSLLLLHLHFSYPASPGRLAERAAPASCDCPELVPGARGEPGAEPRGAGAEPERSASARRALTAPRPPHARPSPCPTPSPAAAAAASAARPGALTPPRSRGSGQPGSGPPFSPVASALHRA